MSGVLENELTNDPLARGYSGMTDQQVADSLNTVDRSRNITSMTGREVRNQVVASEYDALTPESKSQFLALTATDDMDPFGFAVGVIKDVFGNGSTSVSNLATARVELVSRSTELNISPVRVGTVTSVRSS